MNKIQLKTKLIWYKVELVILTSIKVNRVFIERYLIR